jgi:hypothetical protein
VVQTTQHRSSDDPARPLLANALVWFVVAWGAETPGQVKAEGENRSVSYVRIAFAIEISPSNRDLAALLGYRECMEAKRLQKLIQNRT